MTKIPQEIIAKAIQGGWQWRGIPLLRAEVYEVGVRLYWKGDQFSKNGEEYTFVEWEQIALDKDFWIALGVSLNWEHEHMRVNWGQEEHYYVPLWQFYASKFVNLILQEKETDSFWQNLLNV